MKDPVIQDLQRHLKEQDLVAAHLDKWERLCEDYEEKLELMNPEAVESFKEWLYNEWFAGRLSDSLKEGWAQEEAEKEMARLSGECSDD